MTRRSSSTEAVLLGGRVGGWLFGAVAGGGGAAALLVTQCVLLGDAIDDVLAGRAVGWITYAALVGLAAARAGCLVACDACAGFAAAVAKQAVRRLALARVIRRGHVGTDSRIRSGEVVHTLTAGLDPLDPYVAQFLPQAALGLLVPVGVLAVVWWLDPLSALVLAVTGPLIPLFVWLIGGAARVRAREQWQTLARLSARFLDALRSVATLTAFNAASREAGVLAAGSRTFRDVTLGVLRVAFLSSLVLELLATLGVAIVSVEVGLRLLRGHLLFRDAFIVLLLAPEFYRPLRAFGTAFHAGLAGREVLRRVTALTGSARETPAPSERQAPLRQGVRVTPSADRRQAPHVALVGVTAGYEPDAPPALRDVTIEIPPGATVAVVGASGSGKTTLVRLLLGLLRPTSGHVVVNGKTLGGAGLPAWRRRVAWVPQHPHVFNTTILENLRIARPAATADEVWDALERAGAATFVRTLPAGLDTRVGEGGERLSSGERQRIALARAFLKDAPVLVVDEPTAFLDPEMEADIAGVLRTLRTGRTVVQIAHRLATVRDADVILLLRHASVVAAGTHDDLLASCPAYAELWGAATSRLNAQDEGPLLSGTPAGAAQPQRLLVPDEGRTRPTNPTAGVRTDLLRSAALHATTTISGIALLATSAWLIATAAGRPSVAVLGVAIVGVRFFGIARAVGRYVERLVTHGATLNVLARLRAHAFSRLTALGPAWLRGRGTGDVLARLVADVEALDTCFVRLTVPALANAAATVAALAFLAWLHPALALATAGVVIVAGVGLPLVFAKGSHAMGTRLQVVGATLTASLADTLRGLAEVVVFGHAGRSFRRLLEASRLYVRAQVRHSTANALAGGTAAFAADVGVAGMLALTSGLVVHEQLTGILAAVSLLVVLGALEGPQSLVPAAQLVGSYRAAWQRLQELSAGQPAVVDPAQPVPPTPGRVLDVCSLTFRYPDADPHREGPALRDVSFSLRPGRLVALVGSSGSGKSTLVSLLSRHWDVERGSLRLDGTDVRDLAVADVRRAFAIAAQPVGLLTGSIRENLGLGARIDENAAWSILDAVGLGEAIRRMPGRLDAWVGELGHELSGGQQQRLALARALLRDAPLLVLDEPTAQVDAAGEQRIFNVLARERQHRGVLITTHRVRALVQADEILVLRRGVVIQRGTFAELSSVPGWFREALALQVAV